MSSFRKLLCRARAACFAGQFFLGLCRTLAVLLAAALLAALADAGFVLSMETRSHLRLAAACAAGAGILLSFVSACRTARRVPEELDSLNRDSRCTIVCALGLPATGQGAVKGSGALGDWLAQESCREAAEAVRRARRHAPAWRRWAWGMAYLLAAGCSLSGLQAAFPYAFQILGQRLLFPARDIPPLSPYSFIWSPHAPEVPYGEDIALSVHVEGGEPPQGMNLLLRLGNGHVQSLPAFRDRKGDWRRVLEKVTAPCSIAFATADGRARSRFVPVKVNYSPRILGGQVTITPLPYTGKPPTQDRLGGKEILVPDGGSVAITLHCNREIASGLALFTPAGETRPQKAETRVEGNLLHVSMKVRTPGTLSMQVTDSRGLSADSPVRTRLAVLPDNPPEVSITRPEDGSYLLEGSPLELEVEAVDDYGLERLILYKALAPYRQHGMSVIQGKGAEQTYRCVYDTAAMGLKAGDVLEWRAEVGDTNPFRFHIASSPTTSVMIVSEEEYAALLRLEMDQEEFLARYEALETALAQAREALQALRSSSREEGGAAAHAAALQSLRQAKEIAGKIADDFPAFDMDGQLSRLSSEIAGTLEEYIRQLSSLPPGAENLAEKAGELLERLEQGGEELKRQAGEADKVMLLARAVEAQEELLYLYQRQQEMTHLFSRFKEEYGLSSTTEPGRLEGLGAEQASVRDAYAAWEESLSPLLAELGKHEELEPMYQLLFAMRTVCEQSGVEGLMDEAVGAADKHQPADAHAYARQAMEGMQQLISQSCSQEMRRNCLQQSRDNMGSSARDTLQQMLDALKQRREQQGNFGPGPGRGASLSAGGRGRKMLGPARSHWKPRSGGQGRENVPGAAAGQGREGTPRMPGQKGIAPPAPDAVPFPEGSLEQVPASYRDAVRQYFSP